MDAAVFYTNQVHGSTTNALMRVSISHTGFLSLYAKGPQAKPGAETDASMIASFKLYTDVTPLFPYINRVAERSALYQEPSLVRFVLHERLCALYAQWGVESPFSDRPEAALFMEGLIAFLTDIQSRRGETVFRSCGNRHCPTCQNHKTKEWLDRQMKRQLPGHHFMITLTVPEQLRYRVFPSCDISPLFRAKAHDVIRGLFPLYASHLPSYFLHLFIVLLLTLWVIAGGYYPLAPITSSLKIRFHRPYYKPLP